MRLKHLAAVAAICVSTVAIERALAQEKPQNQTPKPEDVQAMMAALPDKAAVKPRQPRKVLVIARAAGYVHSSIPLAARTFEEMGKKTAIRRLCKYLPATAELQRAIALDEQAEAGLEQGLESIIDITEMTEEPRSKLDSLVDKKTQSAAPPPERKENQNLFKTEPPARSDREGNPNYGEVEREPGVEG